MDALEMTLLFDYYGSMLTDKQRECFDMRYNQDLSLGEIADELEVSRQNVHELITRSAQKLRKYEAALGSMKRAEETAKQLKHALSLMESIRTANENDVSRLEEAGEIIRRIIRQQEGE